MSSPERTLQIKNASEFCVILAENPQKIIQHKSLNTLLDFCYNAITSCNCKGAKETKKKILQEKYFKIIKSLTEEEMSAVKELFDNTYKFVYIKLDNDETLQIK